MPDDLWPTWISDEDRPALDALAAAGIGEGDFDGDHEVPADLIELYEVLEWENAVADGEGRDLPHPDIGVPPPNDSGTARSTPFVSRAGWGARAPKFVTTTDLTENTGHYGGPSPWSGVDRSSAARFLATADHNRCPTIVRGYQNFHMDTRGWSDIAYSSLACPHGTRYEGRGRNVRTAAQGTNAGNNVSHATCYIAGDGDPLTDPAKLAYLDEHVRLEGLFKGHRDWKSTACPGNPLYNWIHAGRPRPGGTTPPPTGDWLDMVSLAEFRAETAKIVADRVYPRRLIHDGYVAGDALYVSDLMTYKFEVPRPAGATTAVGSPYDVWLKAVLTINGIEDNAVRLPQAVIDAIPDANGLQWAPALFSMWAAMGSSPMHTIVEAATS
jgi:hypothetical protein